MYFNLVLLTLNLKFLYFLIFKKAFIWRVLNDNRIIEVESITLDKNTSCQ
jgi:hypothetical protein